MIKNTGEAYAIVKNIKTSKRNHSDKVEAIRIVAHMETINGITKDELRNVIRFLLGEDFEGV